PRCIDRGSYNQLSLDRHGRWIGLDARKGDVALLGGCGGLAESERVDGTGQAAPLGGQTKRGEARAVVGAVAQDQEPAQVALAAMPLVEIVKHFAEIGALPVGFSGRIEIAYLARE